MDGEGNEKEIMQQLMNKTNRSKRLEKDRERVRNSFQAVLNLQHGISTATFPFIVVN